MLVDRKDEVISGTAFRLGFSSKGKSPRRKGREEGMDELDHFLAELRENLNCFTKRKNRNYNVMFLINY